MSYYRKMLPQKFILSLFTDPGIIEPDTRVKRFWRNVSRGESCWEWTGARMNLGYGVLATKVERFGKSYRLYAHRVAWVLTHQQDIPEGWVIDHTCGNKACCNPDHLECVTQTVNVDRYHVQQPANGVCKRGHPTTRGVRCAECNKLRVAKWKSNNPEKIKAIQHKHDMKRGKTKRPL